MKIKSLNLKIILLLIICFLSVAGNNKAYSQSKIDCSKAPTQAEIHLCSQNQHAPADKELNELYKKVSSKLEA